MSGKLDNYFGARAKLYQRSIKLQQAIMANFGDDHVVLLEETVQANKDAITENKKLRDELKARDEEHRKVLGEVLKELQNLKDSSQRLPKRRSRSRKVQVPPGCRVSASALADTFVYTIDRPIQNVLFYVLLQWFSCLSAANQ